MANANEPMPPLQHLLSSRVIARMAEEGWGRVLRLSSVRILLLATIAGGFITMGPSSPCSWKHREEYLEPGVSVAERPGVYFRQGVRTIDGETFRRILPLAAPFETGARGGRGYADPESARAVDEVAMEIALERAGRRWEKRQVLRMPHSNPGYDIEVREHGEPMRFIEVKGTRRAAPEFLVSEGERRFSEANSERYTLIVVTQVDIGQRTGAILERDGPLSAHSALRPTQWIGRVVSG